MSVLRFTHIGAHSQLTSSLFVGGFGMRGANGIDKDVSGESRRRLLGPVQRCSYVLMESNRIRNLEKRA